MIPALVNSSYHGDHWEWEDLDWGLKHGDSKSDLDYITDSTDQQLSEYVKER